MLLLIEKRGDMLKCITSTRTFKCWIARYMATINQKERKLKIKMKLFQTHGSHPPQVRPRMLGSVAWSIRQSTCSSTLLHRSPTLARLLYVGSPVRIVFRAEYSGVLECPFSKSNLFPMKTSTINLHPNHYLMLTS